MKTTGNILSMANYPSFDPEKRHTYKGLKLKNRAIHDLIEPGSTIKPFIIYAGLKNKVIEKSTIVYVINKTGGNISKASQILGVTRATLRKKISNYKIDNGKSHK